MKKTLKATWKIVSAVLKVAALLLVILILTPFGYFAWRAGQPMSMPEYDGRTYYELLAERHQAYADLAVKYQAGHPTVDVKQGMCFSSELLMVAYNMPWSGFCALAESVPGLGLRLGPNATHLGCGQGSGSLSGFLVNSWIMYEHLTYDLESHVVNGPVPYCRIPAP